MAKRPVTGCGRSCSGRCEAFVHGIVINVDGVDYYLASAPDGPSSAFVRCSCQNRYLDT